jgi:hypothetical protein
MVLDKMQTTLEGYLQWTRRECIPITAAEAEQLAAKHRKVCKYTKKSG